MTKNEFIAKMKELKLEVVRQDLKGHHIYETFENVWDLLESENPTDFIYGLDYKCTEDEYLAAMKIKEERMVEDRGMYQWKCYALKDDGSICNEDAGTSNGLPIKKVIEENEKGHFCPKHKEWEDSLYRKMKADSILNSIKKNDGIILS